MTGRIHSIETFGTVDGPGIRFVVFLQGCRWRCRYCHNPDTWRMTGGTLMTPESLFEQAMRYETWFSASGGGVTVSGGEPLCQAEFVTAFFTLCREAGLHTCLDTAGDIHPDADTEPLLAQTSLVLLDVKHTDPEAHLALTGAAPGRPIAFAESLRAQGIPTVLRHVVVPGLTDGDAHLIRLVKWTRTMPNVTSIQWLPYHRLGVYKWNELGLPYPLPDTPPADETLMERVRALEARVRADCQPPTHPL